MNSVNSKLISFSYKITIHYLNISLEHLVLFCLTLYNWNDFKIKINTCFTKIFPVWAYLENIVYNLWLFWRTSLIWPNWNLISHSSYTPDVNTELALECSEITNWSMKRSTKMNTGGKWHLITQEFYCILAERKNLIQWVLPCSKSPCVEPIYISNISSGTTSNHHSIGKQSSCFEDIGKSTWGVPWHLKGVYPESRGLGLWVTLCGSEPRILSNKAARVVFQSSPYRHMAFLTMGIFHWKN